MSPNPCKICGADFMYLSEMLAHEAEQHPGEFAARHWHDHDGCWACMLNCIDAMSAALQFIGDTKDPNDSAYAVAEQLRKAIREAQND